MTDINVDLLQWAIEFKHRFCIKELLIWLVKITKNADPDKCKYSGYDIGCDSCSEFSFTDSTWEKCHYFWS